MDIGRLIAAVGIAALRAQMRLVARRVAIRAATAALAGLFFLVAAGFLIAALTVWIASELGTIYALLIVAAIFIVVGGIVFLAGRRPGRSRPVPRQTVAADGPPKPETVAAFDDDVKEPAPPPGSELGSMAVVALAGFMLARQMLKRR